MKLFPNHIAYKFTVLLLVVFATGFVIYSLNLLPWQSTNDNQTILTKSDLGLDSLEDYYNTATDNVKPTENLTEVDFFAVGDIMLSRDVAEQIKRNDNDSFWPFRALETELLSTDFNVGNLESPFSGRDDYRNADEFIFNAPTWSLPGLIQHNFKILSVANNHSLNQGLDGLLYTKSALEKSGTQVVGGGTNDDEAWQGKVFSVKGVRVGFIAANYFGQSYLADLRQTDKLQSSIKELKTRSDFIVVLMHAGEEYTKNPNEQQINFARASIDNGADLVIGSHPHWIQPIEEYQGKYIFYSLGNFIFDQMWSQETTEGLMLKISLEKAGSCAYDSRLSPTGQQQVVCSDSLQGASLPAKLKKIELVPVKIENYGQPRLANEIEKSEILKKIGATTDVITP